MSLQKGLVAMFRPITKLGLHDRDTSALLLEHLLASFLQNIVPLACAFPGPHSLALGLT